jgi:hypothetical protein
MADQDTVITRRGEAAYTRGEQKPRLSDAQAVWRADPGPCTSEGEGIMCFSATASFTASAILTAVGVAAIAQSDRRATLMLAAIPLLFAVQQGAEGIVWLTVTAEPGGSLHAVSMNLFLGFAFVAWPTWFSLSLLRIEADPARRRLLRALAGLGLAVSAVGVVLLLVWQPHALALAHGIRYEFGPPGGLAGRVVYLLLYTVTIVAPFLVSTLALARSVGVLLLAALVVTLAVKHGAVASVWCFFAAAVSVLLAVVVRRARRSPPAAIPPPISAVAPPS